MSVNPQRNPKSLNIHQLQIEPRTKNAGYRKECNINRPDRAGLKTSPNIRGLRSNSNIIVDEFPIAVSTADNGTRKYTTLLSDLLPAAIQKDSPIKERGGRLYRCNIRDEPTSPHHVGKIDTLLAKSSNALLTRQMNEYNLVPLSDGIFVCDVFWEQPSITHAPQSPQATHLEGIQAAATSIPQEINTTTGPLQFTGTGSDVPLDIANSRAQFSPLHEHALPGLRAEFVDFLHAKVKAEVPNMPDQGHDWGRCKPLSTSSLVGGELQEMMIYAERVKKQVDTKDLGLSDEFWAEATG
ncbi:hypothetical protein B0H14DRAFT_3130217 [Mycena olivaceomarginata]|nr:hypothetical protein B0H14DRAFT_3130217 [Mycena olivaceomarginata]